MELGYWLSSEEHAPTTLVRNAQRAEQLGFGFALISDHFHPWLDRQGQSPFVWVVLGALAEATRTLRVGTAVTCPIVRLHPAIVAQAAATASCVLPGRFFLGVGTGENLNEHILGDRWPSAPERLDMLEEAVQVIRRLWEGGYQSFHGTYYRLDRARLYTRPEQPPPIFMSSAGTHSAALAARIADGLIGVAPDRELVEHFAASGGADKPRYAKLAVCWAADAAQARRAAWEVWPTSALDGDLSTELAMPSSFEAAVAPVHEQDVVERVICGPDPSPYLEGIQRYAEAGFEHLALHQIGPDQAGFFEFFERELRPRL